jgi:hypothetical protein
VEAFRTGATTVVSTDFLVVDAVSLKWSPRSNSLFIREIARYLLILEQLEDRRAAKNVDKTPTFELESPEWNREFIAKNQGNLRGEQGLAAARFEQRSPIGKAPTS